ncbi:helix-turn-helix domain-containing protein [Ruminiclostridium herbifermentans]|uniref:Helix-turn-helix domain-containing protein n=1 Tax=Ruminiclostridium herbifermentans TaxID=2488810 RepID=A0A4U7J707_9FIRM|nr:sigma factor-like helix-turn-helix DNA-binding protein [Ruminiclostridium herbifermentans]QNU67250.1 helix-turn-helix domain-containing protein [Ruminiclostridium herbifermentans]
MSMTKEELTRFTKIESEIEQIKNEIKKLEPEYTKDSVTGSQPTYPYIAHQIKIEGYDYNSYFRKIRRIENRLNTKLNELLDTKDKITEYIYNDITDSELRQILIYKYINGKKTREIAEEMGWTSRTIERRLKKWSDSLSVNVAKK